MNPEQLRYTKDHEWVHVEGEVATVGISDYAQEQMGDIVSVEFPQVGDSFSKGDQMILLDSMKASSDVYAPISGEILEVNEGLEDAPEKVNESPYDEGWLVKLKPSNPAEFEDFMDLEAYTKFLKEA